MNKRLLLFAMLITLIASACVKVNLKIDVADDGSAEISGIVALNAEATTKLFDESGLGEGLGGSDELCDQFAAENSLDATEQVESKPYDKDGFCGSEFSGRLSAEEVASEMGGITGEDGVTLRREGDGWFFEMILSQESLGTDDLEEFEEFGGAFDIEDFFGGAEYIVRVRLPGTQVEHNGEIEGDGTVVWDIDLLNPPDRLFLRTEPGEPITGSGGPGGDGDGGNTGLVILIVVLALAALAAAAYFLMRNKGGGDAPTNVMGAPMGAAPPASPPQQFGAPSAPAPLPPEPTPSPSPTTEALGSPTPEEATGSPVWDPARGQYVQWDPTGGRWLVYDDAAGAWQPE